MAVVLTFHNDQRRSASVIGGQYGDAVSVADDAVSDPIAMGGLYRVIATSDCTVRIGSGLEDAENGEPWFEGAWEVRFIGKGEVVAVDAPA